MFEDLILSIDINILAFWATFSKYWANSIQFSCHTSNEQECVSFLGFFQPSIIFASMAKAYLSRAPHNKLSSDLSLTCRRSSWLKRPARFKRSSLLVQIVGDAEKKFYEVDTCGLYYKHIATAVTIIKWRHNLERHSWVIDYAPIGVIHTPRGVIYDAYSTGIAYDCHLRS
jgi:hypothetical protein